MVAVPLVANRHTRPLRADDIERVIAIDRAYSGHSRRRFFEKRFAAVEPEDFVHVGVVQDGVLRGYAIARVLRGEFGHKQTVAVLDAIGVDAGSRERGVGQALMAELNGMMSRRNIQALQSQAEWTNQDLMRFFAAAGFQLAPRLTLQRPVAALLDEPSEQV